MRLEALRVRRRLKIAGCFLCLAVALALFGEQGYVALKARLAERLISRAYTAYLQDGAAHPPWSWADTHPIGRLDFPRLGIQRTLLAGASGTSLAFGPGHIDGTAAPNTPGNCCVAGHRDTSFGFLGDLHIGDALWLETQDARIRYRVIERSVRSMWDGAVLERTPHPRLTLITCWPLDAWVPGPERLVVIAEPHAEEDRQAANGGQAPLVVRPVVFVMKTEPALRSFSVRPVIP
jgi:sortase A